MKELRADGSDVIGIDSPFLHGLLPPCHPHDTPSHAGFSPRLNRMLPPIAPGSKKVIDKRRMAHKIALASVQRIRRIKHTFASTSPRGYGTDTPWRRAM